MTVARMLTKVQTASFPRRREPSVFRCDKTLGPRLRGDDTVCRLPVAPAKAGAQFEAADLGPRLRGDDTVA